MTDPNVEKMLKQIKKNNYVADEGGSNRKRKAMQEQQMYQEAYSQQVNSRAQQPVKTNSSREQRRSERERERGNSKKQYPTGTQPPYSVVQPNGNFNVNMIYHPLTSKGNTAQQFSFQDNGP